MNEKARQGTIGDLGKALGTASEVGRQVRSLIGSPLLPKTVLFPGSVLQRSILQALKPVHIPGLNSLAGLRADRLFWQRDLKPIFTPSALGLTPLFESFRKSSEMLRPLIRELFRHDAEAKRIEAAGWLPHPTAPFEALADPDLADEAVAALLSAHYVEGWPTVRAALQAALAGYAIDDLAKSALEEAFDNHEAGRYRSVVALVFNEIERVARVELHGGGVGRMASLPRLRELAGETRPGDHALGGGAALRLFRRLADHFYCQVNTGDDVARLAADPVPNRHAAAHGLVVYDTVQNSLNMLIMADYVFQVISLAKSYAQENLAA